MPILTNLNVLVEDSVNSNFTNELIKQKYESNDNTNSYTDNEKLLVDATTTLDTTATTLPTSINEIHTELNQFIATKAQANGLASLDTNGAIPSSQLPSYVDDVIEVATRTDLPVIGESGKIYIVTTDETSGGNTSSYRWTGTVYAMVSNTLTATDVKFLYESNADTNVYTDAEQTRVDIAITLDTVSATLPTAINEVHEEVNVNTQNIQVIMDTMAGLSNASAINVAANGTLSESNVQLIIEDLYLDKEW